MSLMFFAVMAISASISITVLLMVFKPILRDNAESQVRSVVTSMKTLEDTGDFSADDIIELCINGAYKVEKLSEDSGEIKKNKKEVDSGKLVIDSAGFIPNVIVYTKINGEYIKIDTFSNENVYWITGVVVIIAFIVCILLGTVITAFISRSILQPIRDLNKATTEVARGNFDVRVREPLDLEYGNLTRNFNKMAQELSGIETLRGDFISNVSHEFKTPLASIQGFAKLLQDKDISEQDRDEYTQIIINETTRLSKLSINILNLSKLENQLTIGSKKRFSLDEQIRRIILMLEPEWSKKDIDFDVVLDDIYYLGNQELMDQIWQNLINNAIKFSPQGGKISVRLFQTERNITVRVSDNGIGITHENKQKIFEKFYQGDNSRKTEGNGLGLALVKRIIDLCNGKIFVEDVYGGGVCFVVELPFIIEDMR